MIGAILRRLTGADAAELRFEMVELRAFAEGLRRQLAESCAMESQLRAENATLRAYARLAKRYSWSLSMADFEAFKDENRKIMFDTETILKSNGAL